MRIGTNMNTNKFENKFENKLGKRIEKMSFYYKPLLYFVAANQLIVKIICMLSIPLFGITFTLLIENIGYNSYLILYLFSYLISFITVGLHFNKSLDILHDEIASYGYGKKQFFIFELKTKE